METLIKDIRDYPDKVRLTKEDLETLQNGDSVVVNYRSPVDIMIGQYQDIELLVLPPLKGS